MNTHLYQGCGLSKILIPQYTKFSREYLERISRNIMEVTIFMSKFISKSRLLQLIVLVALCFSITSCRVNTNPSPTEPTSPTDVAGKQAPSLDLLKVFFSAEESNAISDNSRQPILLKSTEQVTLFATFTSSTPLESAQIFLFPEDNSASILYEMNCNEKYECNYLWDLANPQMDTGLYTMTVRARNTEATITTDYNDAFLVY